MPDLAPLWRRDPAALVPIARAEQLRQVEALRHHGKDAAGADRAWAEIVLWLEQPAEMPEDPHRTYGYALRIAELVRVAWANEADQSSDNPKVPMYLGLLQIERLMLLELGHLFQPDQPAGKVA